MRPTAFLKPGMLALSAVAASLYSFQWFRRWDFGQGISDCLQSLAVYVLWLLAADQTQANGRAL